MSNSHVQSAKAIAGDIAHFCCVPDDWRLQISDLASCAAPVLAGAHAPVSHAHMAGWRVSETGVSVSEASGSVSETVEFVPEASVCVTAISVSGRKQGVSDPETGFTVMD